MAEAVTGEVLGGEREQEERYDDPEHPYPSGSAGWLRPARQIRHAGIK
jgi:hypothetical protein